MFCESEFLNENQYWNTTDPDFSPCFQKTVLLGVPCAFLVLLAPLRILILHNGNNNHIVPWNWRSRTKLVLAGVIGLLKVLDIAKAVYTHFSGQQEATVNFLSPLVVVLTMIVFALVVHTERKNSIRSSGFLFMFWFLLSLFSIVIVRSKIRHAVLQDGTVDVFYDVTFYLFFVLMVTQLVLCCIVDIQPVGAVPVSDLNPCPEHNVSFLSQITFWWLTSLIVKGYKNPLVQTDLWNLNERDKCRSVYPAFNKHWQYELNKCKRVRSSSVSKSVPSSAAGADIEMKDMAAGNQQAGDGTEVKVVECKKPEPGLFWAMLKTFGPQCLISGVLKLVYDVLQFVSPIVLKYLIDYTTNKSEHAWKGFWYAGLLLFTALVQSVFLHMYFYYCTVVGMRLRTAIIATVYQKMLKLSNVARKTSTVGEIVNLMSVDAQRFNDMMTYIHIVWSGPVQISLCIYFLWVTLGPSIVAGVALMIIMIPLNAFIANKFKEYQVKQMNLKDKRIKMMNEILNGIKVLKLYGWEPSFEKKVLDIRNKELGILKRMSYLNAITSFTWTVAPFAVSLITFAVYVMVDDKNILDAEKAFVSLALFNILRFPLSMIPQVMSSIVQVNVSLKRLRKFLGNDELNPDAVQEDDQAKHSVKIKDGSFSWDEEGTPTLQNINLEVGEGSLIAVVGTVGSGKTSLLQAVLGEMEKISGSVTVKGSVAYVAQQAWIQNATLQDNILFGRPAEVSEYRSVIEACALQPDLEIMPAGDQTEIGEKGINLSGGQKQRVSLARAVYQDADMYLLDDPLSAVDSHVGKHIFEKVIGPDGLLKGKTRILVTHGVGFLPKVDTIVVLVDGQVSELGSYKELLSHDGAFAQFLKNYLTEELDKENAEDMELDEETISQIGSIIGDKALQRQVSVLSERMHHLSESHSASPPGTPNLSSRKSPDSPTLSRSGEDGVPHKRKGTLTKQKTIQEVPNGVGKKEEEKKLIEAEKMETDRVKFNVFFTYLRAVGVILSSCTVLFYILYNVSSVYSNIWLSEWSNDANTHNTNGTVDTAQRDLRLGVYGALGLIQGIFMVIAVLFLYIGNVRAGRILHAGILRNILFSPMAFFDSTPVGRILNRFGKDIDILDTLIVQNIHSWMFCFLRVVTVPIIVAYSTPMFLTAAVPMFIFYFLIQEYFIGFFTLLGALSLFTGNLKAGQILHADFLKNIMSSPMSFFDSTPTGRILNRFSRDIDVLDIVICMSFRWVIYCFLEVINVPIVVAYGTPMFLVAAVPMFIGYILIQETSQLVFEINVVPYEMASNSPFDQGLLESISAFLMAVCGIKASKKIFYDLFRNVIRLPLQFFDTTPAGRILNRMCEDIADIDYVMPFTVRSMCNLILRAIGTLAVLGATLPLFLTTLPPLAIVYFFIQRFYVATSRQLKRLESVSRSPIYSQFGETVMGATTVRAYRQQARFIEGSEKQVDNNLMCHYPSIIANRWLAIRLEFVGNCIVFFAALFAVIARDSMSPGIVGLSITYALSVTQTLNWMVRMTTELETNIVAVERVKEYSETPTEAAWEVPEKQPKDSWPDQGLVEFQGYGTRYREGLDLVIKGINCSIKPSEKVGIVGRTGAGKSSLTLALFRIIEAAQGKIVIDGVDIGAIGLKDVRSRLTIIPQEPVLFSGTLRMNLDPFDQYKDDQVWEALEHAHLKSFVSELPTGLEHECTEGGENLSVGQRQLVCLARALLRKTKILVLDEATAAVDLETDDLIQHTIRVEFKDATVLTIAHRLNTIMDYTRVMVLDKGEIREFDSPQGLLQDENSIFYGMAKDAGLV